MGISVKKAIRYGVARGLFSNEAGMGSTPHAHAIAKVEHCGEQGIVAMITVFIYFSSFCYILRFTASKLIADISGIGWTVISIPLLFNSSSISSSFCEIATPVVISFLPSSFGTAPTLIAGNSTPFSTNFRHVSISLEIKNYRIVCVI